jgi:predicted kinase
VGSDPVELVILIGLPGAGKTTFHRARFAATHVHVSKDLMRNRRDRQRRQMALVDEALAAGRSVVVDNTNVTVADRAALIEAARRRGAAVAGYVFATSPGECAERNRGRVARARVPDVAIHAAAKRWERPARAEGFDRLWQVRAEAERFDLAPYDGASGDEPAGTIFLLSPASTEGERGALLLNDRATFPLALQLRSKPGVPLGDVFSFVSSLYFRGKLTYAQTFGRPPARLCRAFVITPGEGLRDPAEPVTIERLRRYAAIPIKSGEPRYRKPLARDAEALRALAGERCRIVLLGSVASSRYVEPLLDVFGDHLFFPPTFVGRGDMSRGGLLLRCVREGRELEYAPVAGAMRHGPRPPRLPARAR